MRSRLVHAMRSNGPHYKWFNYEDAVFTNSILIVFEPLTILISAHLKVTRMVEHIINVGFIYYELKAILISVIDAVDIASVLTNIDDRSSSMTFSGAMQISSKTNFNAKCS